MKRIEVAPIKPTVSFEVFEQIDIRVGMIKSVEDIDGADNLVRNRAVIDYRIQMQNSGPGVIENGMGWIDLDEMAKLARESLKLGILKKEMDVSKIFTNKFIK